MVLSRSGLWSFLMIWYWEDSLIKENFGLSCRKNWVILQNGEIRKGINVRTDNKHFCCMLRIGNDWRVLTVEVLIKYNTKICKYDLWMDQKGLSSRQKQMFDPFSSLSLPPTYSDLSYLKRMYSNWKKFKQGYMKR